jgi:hypothetical protein
MVLVRRADEPQRGADGEAEQHLAHEQPAQGGEVDPAGGVHTGEARVEGDGHAVVDEALRFRDDDQPRRERHLLEHGGDGHGVGGGHQAPEQEGHRGGQPERDGDHAADDQRGDQHARDGEQQHRA